MANEVRIFQNFQGGRIDNNPLAVAGTSLSSPDLASLSAVDTTNHMLITLDPDGIAGAPEVVKVTAHTASATTATIARAQEGTTAREHLIGTDWVHSAYTSDFGFHGCLVYRSSAQNIANAGHTVTWNAEKYDTDGYHDNSTNSERLTIPTGLGGLYMCGGVVGVTPAGTANKTFIIDINLNGVAAGHVLRVPQQAGSAPYAAITFPARLVAGDYLTCTVYQDSGGVQAMSTSDSEFWLHRIGA